MQQPIVIQGRTILVSNQNPSTVTFTPTTVIDTPASRTSGKGGASVLVDRIAIQFACSGTAPGGTFAGTGSGTIVASTPRVECEGKQMLTENDFVNVTCNGTVTSGTTSSPYTATATFTITHGVQKNVDANKA